MKTFSKIAVAAALALGTISAPALAGEQPEQVVVSKVSYNDLDLSTTDGLNTLKSRFELAARQVCGMNVKATGTMLPSREARACYVKTRTNIAPRMALLASRHARRG